MTSVRVLHTVAEKPQHGKSRRISEDVTKHSSFKIGLRERIRRTKSVPEELTALESAKRSGSIGRREKNERSKASRASSSAHVQYVVLRTVILDTDTVQLLGLIDRKDVNVNYMDPDGLLPIHYAAKSGNVNIMEILVSAGADINAVSRKGDYPLDFAVKEGNFDIARYLIENGAMQNNIVDGIRSTRRTRASSIDILDNKKEK